VYLKYDELVPGRVIGLQGTLDKRDDAIRATAKAEGAKPDPADVKEREPKLQLPGTKW